jgi:hypothetical protein
MNRTLIQDMSVFEQARWYSLIECVNMIAEECEKRKKKFNKMQISPLDVKEYIESTCDIFARKIEEELSSNDKKDISLNLYNLSIQPELKEEATV